MDTRLVADLVERTLVGVDVNVTFGENSTIGVYALQRLRNAGKVTMDDHEGADLDMVIVNKGGRLDPEDKHTFRIAFTDRTNSDEFAVHVGEFLDEMRLFGDAILKVYPFHRREQGQQLARIRDEVMTTKFQKELTDFISYKFVVKTTISYRHDVPEIKFELFTRWATHECDHLVTTIVACLWGNQLWQNGQSIGLYQAGTVHMRMMESCRKWMLQH